MGLDDGRDDVGQPQVDVSITTKPTFYRKVHRVSWMVGTKRQEEFFEARPWAEQFVIRLMEAALLVGVSVDPMIGDIEVKCE